MFRPDSVILIMLDVTANLIRVLILTLIPSFCLLLSFERFDSVHDHATPY